MGRKLCSEKVAVVDLDETLIEGAVGSLVARAILDPRKNRGIIPRRYYLRALRYIYVPVLVKLKRIYRIYRYLLHKSYSLYLDILNDPRVDKERLHHLVKETVENVDIPEVSRLFISRLKERGYKVVLLTATPQEMAEIIGRKLGVDEVVGSLPGRVFDRETKERFIRERFGCVDIIVGNPGNEPFWLAKRYAIIVRSPRDLTRWLDKI